MWLNDFNGRLLWSCDRTTTTTVIDQSINGLSIRFRSGNDDTRAFNSSKRAKRRFRANHTTIEVVQVRGSKRPPSNWTIGRRSGGITEGYWEPSILACYRFVEGIQDIQTTNSLHIAFWPVAVFNSSFKRAISASKSTCFKRSWLLRTHLSYKGFGPYSRKRSRYSRSVMMGFVLAVHLWIDHGKLRVNDFLHGHEGHIQGQSYEKGCLEVPDVWG